MAGGVRAKRGASPLLAEGGELSDDGLCRLSPYGFVIKDYETGTVNRKVVKVYYYSVRKVAKVYVETVLKVAH